MDAVVPAAVIVNTGSVSVAISKSEGGASIRVTLACSRRLLALMYQAFPETVLEAPRASTRGTLAAKVSHPVRWAPVRVWFHAAARAPMAFLSTCCCAELGLVGMERARA